MKTSSMTENSEMTNSMVMADKFLTGRTMIKTTGMRACLRTANCMERANGCSRTEESKMAPSRAVNSKEVIESLEARATLKFDVMHFSMKIKFIRKIHRYKIIFFY